MTRQARSVGAGGTAAIDIGRDSSSRRPESGDRGLILGEYRLFFHRPHMNLHEYQSKEVFREYGIPVPSGKAARSAEEAVAAAKELGGKLWVVKAQVHAGGRGKAGGVKLARDLDTVRSATLDMLGQRLVTKQTGPEGLPIETVYVESGSDIEREIYLSLTLNRERGRIAVIASEAGGMDIEEVAEHTPEKILRVDINPAAGLQAYQCRKLAFGLNFKGPQIGKFQSILMALYRIYLERDAALLEVNPLIVTKAGDLMALDAKINIDANAMFRQKDLAGLRDPSQEDPIEREASEHDLNYVSLDGDIACMVNGAGLAMSTMDLIKLHGGEPANFLDVGGGANTEQVTEAFRILLADKNVKAVLVNIFGGIMRCTTIANAILEAYKQVDFNVPLVVRLEGTEVEEGRKILANSGIKVINAEGLTDAAKKVVAAAKAA